MTDDYYPTLFTILLSLSDAFWYGYCHEIKGWFKTWLFKEYPFAGEQWVPFYRVFLQWPLDVIAVYLVYTNCGFWSTVLMLLSWYFMNKEMNYYLILGQLQELKEYEINKTKVYWLANRIYFSGAWFFLERFTVKNFVISYALSWVLLILASII